MATLSKDCDLVQGYAFNADGRQTYGHLKSLKIGDLLLPADLTVSAPDPIRGTTSSRVVGVLDSAYWDQMLAIEQIAFTARISGSNRQQLAALSLGSVTKVVVGIDFVVNDYDPVASKYYASFKSYRGTAPSVFSSTGLTGTPIYGGLPVAGGVVSVQLGSTPQQDVPGHADYQLAMQVGPVPAPTPQQLLVQTPAATKMIEGFGLPQT